MGLKFNENNDKPNDKDKVTSGSGSDELLERLRGLVSSANEADLNDDAQLEKLIGKDNMPMARRIQDRINELTDVAREFIDARDAKQDVAPIMLKFTRLVQDTVIRFSPFEVASIVSTGVTALATLEKAFGVGPTDLDTPNNDD